MLLKYIAQSTGYVPKASFPTSVCSLLLPTTLPALAGIDVHDEESMARLDDKRIPPVDGVNVWSLIVGDANPATELPQKEIPLSHNALPSLRSPHSLVRA